MSTDTVIASLQERIDDLNQQAWEARVNDSPRAFQLSKESVHLARSINYSKGLAEGLRSLGFGYVRLFKNDEAAPLLRESLSLFKALNDVKGQAVVYEYLGIIERNWGNLGASLDLLLKGYALIQQGGTVEIEVTCCYQIGVTYKHLGNHENALDYLYRALSIAKKSDNALMEAYAINIIGSIYFDNGDYNDALDCYQRGLVIRRESHDKWGEAGSLDNIGSTYLKLNDLDKAVDYCKQSLKITQSTGDKKGEANTLLHLAEIFQQAGDVGQASKFSNESLAIRNSRGDRRGEAEVLLFLADLYKNRSGREDHQIFEWLSGALKIADEIKAQDLLSKAHYNLHEYHTQRGNHKESLIQLEAHLQIEKELHKNTINQKISNLEISHRAEVISQRNKELIELNEKIEKANAELKIEASLERVRAVAMSMMKPENLLNICEILFAELELLGFKELRNTIINIYHEEKGSFLSYDCFGPGETAISSSYFNSHPASEKVTKQIRGTTDAFVELILSGNELEDWKKFREANGEIADAKLKDASELYYYFYSVGTGALGISTLKPIPAEKVEILKRFKNVFALSYRRYRDIEKAQAQAREAQIEAALERVRAKSMAMHHSNDLISVINVVQEQLLGLGFHFHGANFVTDYNENGYTMWLAAPGESFPYKIYVPQIGQKYFEAVNEAIEKGSDFATYTLNFEEKNNYFKNLFENSLAKNTSEEGKRIVHESKGMAASVVLLGKVRLNLMNLDMIPFTDEENDILKRFGYVFEQSYTRFLDLQKAEAQAREAQIETGLERVRSKTMAMHKSEEVTGVAVSLNEELLKLGFEGGSTIIIMDKETGGTEQWTGFSADKSLKSCYVPYFEHPCHDAQLNAWKNGEEFLVYTLAGEEKKSLDEHYFTTGYKDFPESDKRWMRQMESVTFSHAFMKYGAIHWGPGHLSEEQLRILQRFSKVFEQSYRRFLDLQKAEAQARDAQIEAAVEKVRSRSLAMHKSDELQEVVHTVFERLKDLNVDFYTAIIILFTEGSKDVVWWLESKANQQYPRMLVPFAPLPYFNDLYEIKESGGDLLSKCYSFDEKNELFRHLFENTDFRYVPEKQKQFLLDAEFATMSVALARYTGIHITSYDKKSFSDQDNQIIKKFSKVFDQAYTRFLDLQKAEAQARDAQIEAALERVRSRSMAMHKSDELLEVVAVVFQQMQLLGFNINLCNIVLFNGTTLEADYWVSTNEQEILPESYHIPYFDHSFYQFQLNAWKKAKPLTVFNLDGEAKRSWDEILFTQTDLKRFPASLKKMMKELEKIIISSVATKHGLLQVIGHEPLSNEYAALLSRFAKVFEQTYTRFLDLQKVEAQAREAQIEVALERIRARAMAMHSSNELMDVANILREQMGLLDQPDLETSVVNLFEEDSELIFSWNASRVPGSSGKIISSITSFLKNSSELTREMMSLYQSGEKEYTLEAAGLKLMEFLKVLIQANPRVADYIGNNPPEKVFYHFTTFTGGNLLTVSYQPPSEETKSLQRRAASVFDMAYRRYLDLKKAEAQAREAQTEVALERIRARAMAMHTSNELMEVAHILREQMGMLDQPDLETSVINLFDEDSDYIHSWHAFREPGASGKTINGTVSFRKDSSELTKEMIGHYHSGKKEYTLEATGEKLHEFIQVLINSEPEISNYIGKNPPEKVYYHFATFAGGALLTVSYQPTTEEIKSLQRRAASVFDMAYRRYRDLKKAEAQARDAQIEVALERVRAKVMAMTSSNELNETSLVFGEQLRKLGIDWQFSYFWLIEEVKNENTFWITWPDNKTSFTTYTLAEAEEYFNDCLISWRAGVKIHDNYVPPAGVQEWLDTFQRIADDAGGEAKKIMVPKTFSNGVYYYDAMMKYGSFGICISKPATDEEKKIQCRFAIEFERAYTRFLDLKQAEAQAREARIEVALERVRAKAMAMHKSDDLKTAVATVFEELDKLNIGILRCGIAIMDKEKPRADVWITVKSKQTNTIQVSGDEPLDYHPLLRGAYDGWVKQEDFSYVLQGEDLLNYYRDVASIKYQLPVSTPFDKEKIDQQQYYFNAVFQDGSLFAFMDTAFTDEAKTVMKRFANVFNLTYKRFLDLQKAEAQAREAQIELGLERVRARAMAMQKSAELKELIATVSTELSKLDIVLDRSFIMTYDIKTLGTTWWMANPETSSDPVGLYVKYHEQAPYLAFLKAWQDRVVKWQYILEGSVKRTWDAFLFVETELSRLPSFVIDNMRGNDKVYLSASFNNFGCLTLATLEPLSDEQFDIMLRFAKVFDLTYTRFNDLKQAEAQAREARIEAALERVRARALAMQEPEELKDVAHILRTEMGLLGVEELETCSIYINDESAEKAECWYALKDISSEEKKLVNDHFALNLRETWVGREMLRFYQSPQKQISIVMQGENRKEWIRYCEEHSAPFRGYYGEVIPDRTYHLYKFSHGAIGAAAAGDISEESWRMLSRAASVFTLAYSRFKDLTQARTDLIKLKEEKKRAEEALTELQATQKQLIQSEKMASLGELTAGIAHEIQNPLNFVNNFSDVSNELLEEMKQELATGNTQQAIEIVNGVKENLEKILHHGKRADAIVKGMLQHSRSSSGQKELTDINTLAEEYLRLAYHGLRAKDKFFNAKFETNLDPSLGKINVVPQEIGRVILNLINNAFYAVTEKKKSLAPSPKGVQEKTTNDYEPMVAVTTKRLGSVLGDRGSVEIRITDNGNGIPQKVLDKIFQPFFTTKPTGQGTGLGLSLSYDIITKGHQGEIKVDTKEGEGTEFTIILPMN